MPNRQVLEQIHAAAPTEVVRELRALAAAGERPLAGEVRLALREHIARHRAEQTPEHRSAA